MADSRAALLEPDGLSDSSLPAALSAKDDRRSLGTLAERRPRSLLANGLQKDALLVDMTASTEEEPLVISVPGAGPEVTATGVLGGIIDIALLRTS